jgi:apolipoprotein N-acyltransferase
VQGQPRLEETGVRQRPLLLLALPLISGALCWLSFPKIAQDYLAWVALVPLLLFIVKARNPGSALLGGFLAGFVQFFCLLYWIPRVLTIYGGIPLFAAWGLYALLIAAFGCFPAMACVLIHCGIQRRGLTSLLLFAPAWVAVELFRSWIPFGGFPWMLMGYSQTEHLKLIQIADVVGVYGISLMIVWVNAALAWMILFPAGRWRRWVPIAVGMAAVLVCLIYGSAALRRWDQIKPQHRAALLQGNLSVDVPESALRWKYQQGYVEMVGRLQSESVDLLVLPESPAPLLFQYDQAYQEVMRGIARRFRMGMVFNNIHFRDVAGTTRYFNSAFFLDQNGTEAGRYDKIHLVPFGEYIPWKRLFFFSDTISRDVGNFAPGTDTSAVFLDGHPMNAIICFEAVFPDLSGQFIQSGSQLIINVTNDGWYGDTSAPYQHLAMARWRALESRRYLLRAANSGISAIVEPSGRIQVQTALLRQDTAIGGFSFLSEETFYVRHGRSLPIACVIISFCALFWILLPGTRISNILDLV